MPKAHTTTLNTSRKRKVFRMPSWSFLPKNWAPKIEAPERPPKMVKLKMNTIWLTMATPDMGAVPKRPTITLSRRFTNWVMPCCTIMGMSRAKTEA